MMNDIQPISISQLPSEIKKEMVKLQYNEYVKMITYFENHIERLHRDLVIPTEERITVLKTINILVKDAMKTYNSTMVHIDKDSQGTLKSMLGCPADLMKQLVCIKNFTEEKNVPHNPFHMIKDKLLELALKYGFYSIDTFIKLAFDDRCNTFIDYKKSVFFHVYNDIFIPYEARIVPVKCDSIVPSEPKCDCVDNTCSISIKLNQAGVVFEGYIRTGSLNIISRSSQVFYKHIHSIKMKIRDITTTRNPDISMEFINRYIKTNNSSILFVNTANQISDAIVNDKKYFDDLNRKKINDLMKDFIDSDIKGIRRMIFLLLLGNQKSINNAAMLFSLLKDKKTAAESVSTCIYNSLSFDAQCMLDTVIINIKAELARIKNIILNPITIEEKLSFNPDMPLTAKQYILEKTNELNSDNSFKNQLAVDGLINFPWKTIDNDMYVSIKKSFVRSRSFISRVAKKIDNTVYGHEMSKKTIIELIGKWMQNPSTTGAVIGLVGPPGCGKTLLAESIARAIDLPISIIGLGGISDASDLIGHSFTYVNSQYGIIVRQMIKAGNWRCVLFFDELDKVSKRNDTNEIFNVLIHLTDPNMNQHFQDRFYSSSIEFDLSGALIIFSYNDSSKIDPVLLDRIKEIQVSAYNTTEKISISQKYILPELCNSIGFNREKISMSDDIIKTVIDRYTVEAGVRDLKRKLEEIVLRINLDRYYMKGPFKDIIKQKYMEKFPSKSLDSDELSDTQLSSFIDFSKSKMEERLGNDVMDKIFNMETNDPIIITEKLIDRYLNKPTVIVKEIKNHNMVGVVNGLYASTNGLGGITPIQVYKNYFGNVNDHEHLKLKLTGNQKKIMRESVVCALTAAIHILNDNMKKTIQTKFPYGFHIHSPDGNTPKDGPSAGCAMAIAFISVILGKKINSHVAMTGEIELTGKISKIGSLESKLVGAKKAGITLVYICKDNMDDYANAIKNNNELNTNFTVKSAEHIIEIAMDPNVIIDIKESDFDSTILKEHINRD